jgi:hypothetical protein
MAVPLLPILLPIARTIVSYVGKHGTKQAIKKFGEKYGAKVVDKAQRIVQEGTKGSTRKIEVFPWAKEVGKRVLEEAPKQKRISRKKGGVLNKNSIDGIATQGKTNPKYF